VVGIGGKGEGKKAAVEREEEASDKRPTRLGGKVKHLKWALR
jgi:hypothetical protein